MQIVLDSNILFSALIKDSNVRKIILEYDGKFLFPSYIFDEIDEHKSELISKSGLNSDEFKELLQIILKKVKVVPANILNNYKNEAFKITEEIDLDDSLFIACALAFSNSIILSNDKKLKKQTRIKVFNTLEIIDLLKIDFDKKDY